MPESLAIFLATSGHSGVDRIMGNLIRELSRRGQPVDLLRVRNHGPYLDNSLPHVRIIQLPVAHVNSAIMPLVRYLRSEQPSVLLTDKDRVNRIAIIASRIARTKTRIAIRIGTTVSINLARRRWLHRNLQYLSIRFLYPWADLIIVPSEGAAMDLIGIAKNLAPLVQVLPSPVGNTDLDLLSQEVVEHPWLVRQNEPIILGMGELCGRKDFETLIKAFSIVRKTTSSKLIILGEGKKRGQLERLVGQLELGDAVSMPGFVTNPYPYMKRASVFVLSSKCEGAPVVLMEALSLGVPVVSTDCPSGPREILQGGRLGQLVPVGAPDALARAILHTLDNPPDPELLRAAALAYSTDRATDQYLRALGLCAIRNRVGIEHESCQFND